MDNNFFYTTRILDGGMGQELLARGVPPQGTLWGANALLHKQYHHLILEVHLDFIKAGAEAIITSTFTTRKNRLRENGVEDKFEYLNTKAGEIARQAQEQHPHVLIGGGLPPQENTYVADTRGDDEITQNFYEQAKILAPFIDFFYLDALSSIREFKLAINAIDEFNKPYLIGIHISQGTTLPSHEKISDITAVINASPPLGIILACVSPENFEQNIVEIKNIGIPFGFKFNAFKTTNPSGGYSANYTKRSGNPNEFLGTREDLTPERVAMLAEQFKESGATILGGCCETTPAHIRAMAKLK